MEEESKDPKPTKTTQPLKPKYEKWLALSQRMDAKNDEKLNPSSSPQVKQGKKLHCTSKALNETNLMQNYSKEDLVSFILTNREKLLVDEKKHKRDYIKKPKK